MVVARFRPIVTIDNKTFDALYGVQQEEMEVVNDNVLQIFENKFIETANLDGVEKYERIYRIRADVSSTEKERREIVYNKMTFKPPFTKTRFDRILENVFGKNNYSYEVNPQTLEISIVVPNKISSLVYNRYVDNLRRIIPANVYIVLATPYTYVYLQTMTYEQLANYKYYELSQYSIFVVTYPRFASSWTSGDDVAFNDSFIYEDEGLSQYLS